MPFTLHRRAEGQLTWDRKLRTACGRCSAGRTPCSGGRGSKKLRFLKIGVDRLAFSIGKV